MNYTSVEQSKHLLELGLSPETADIFLPCYGGNDYAENRPYFREHVYAPDKEDLPCWSVGALLNLMPPYLFEWDRGIDLQIYPHLNKKHGWIVSYMPNNVESMQRDKFRQNCHADTLIEAAYNMVVWLLENNYIEK